MTRFTQAKQLEILRAKKRYNTLIKLLDAHDWKESGYADKFAWLNDLYGPGHSADQLFRLQAQFEQENLL